MYTEKMRTALRRDTADKQNIVTDLLDEIDRLTKENKQALAKAVTGIYLADSSDYRNFLWEIVHILGSDEAYNLLEEDERKAMDKYGMLKD